MHTQVMLLMLPMMIRVMNRHSQGRGCYVMMSSWLRGKELEGSMTSALGVRHRRDERGGEKQGNSDMDKKERMSQKWDKLNKTHIFLMNTSQHQKLFKKEKDNL